MRTLQKIKRPINPNNKNHVKKHQESGATKVLTVVVLLSLGKESTQREYKLLLLKMQ
jgi:hypothetical protein